MKTKKWNVNPIDQQAMEEAARLLRDGETVAFPTETVYGLGADATNPQAVAKIFEAKGRPQDNPLIAHVATKEQLKELVTEIPDYVEKIMERFSPGPITYVLPSSGICADNVTAGLTTIGVRIPDHPVALALLRATNRPVAAPSANTSGKPSPTTAQHVWDDLQGKIAGIVDGGPTGVGVESTVIDCTDRIPVILRPGGITKEQLEEVVDNVLIDPGLASQNKKPKSPGMKYRHYSPEAPLWLIHGDAGRIQAILNEEKNKGKRVAVLASEQTARRLDGQHITSLGESMEEIAAHLYDALRKYKEGDIDLILCEGFQEDGIGQAVMNRLHKAASKVIH